MSTYAEEIGEAQTFLLVGFSAVSKKQSTMLILFGFVLCTNEVLNIECVLTCWPPPQTVALYPGPAL